MIDILKIYFYIKAKLENSPEVQQFFYHGWMHTKAVYDAICYLTPMENIDNENFEELKIAALYHDTGYTTGESDDHEYRGADIARMELPLFGIADYRISHICMLIVSTVPEYRPIGIVEEIMHDADLEYIGRDYYPYVAELLRREKSILHDVWRREQVTFLKNHQFITDSARKLFDRQKEINIRILEDQKS